MPDNDKIAGVYIEMIDTPGQIWFDHFRLYEGKYIEDDLELVFGQLADRPVEGDVIVGSRASSACQ
jgi:hypothetical protein